MYKILAIEDSALFLQSLKIWLEMNGMHVICSQNSQLVLHLAKNQMPDLIICDIRILTLDGYKILNALRQDPLTREIPLIFLTSTDSDRYRAMELGADDCFDKFSIFEKLVRAIKAQLNSNKSTQLLVQ